MTEEERVKVKTFLDKLIAIIKSESLKQPFRQFGVDHSEEFNTLYISLVKLWLYSLSPAEKEEYRLTKRDEEGQIKAILHRLKKDFPDSPSF